MKDGSLVERVYVSAFDDDVPEQPRRLLYRYDHCPTSDSSITSA